MSRVIVDIMDDEKHHSLMRETHIDIDPQETTEG
jgi:hypothetical protein